MFLENGHPTETVDALHYLWNNRWPSNRAPTIDSIFLNDKTVEANIMVKPGERCESLVWARSWDNDSLFYEWEILPGSINLSFGGDYESRPETLRKYGSTNPLSFIAPIEPGAYRIFVYVSNSHGKYATANIPFWVEKF